MRDDWDNNPMHDPDDSGDPISDSAKSPSVLGEEDPFSGDASDSVAVDIDDELAKVGLTGDSDTDDIKPLDVSDELDEQ